MRATLVMKTEKEMAGSLRLQGGMGASVARIASLLMASGAQQCSS
jgi:hypothetical protein